MTDNKDITKYLIYGIGIATAVAFIYLIFRGQQQIVQQSTLSLEYIKKQQELHESKNLQLQNNQLQTIEQKLLQLESKIDSFTKNHEKLNEEKELSNNSANTVSMKFNTSNILRERNRPLKDIYGLI